MAKDNPQKRGDERMKKETCTDCGKELGLLKYTPKKEWDSIGKLCRDCYIKRVEMEEKKRDVSRFKQVDELGMGGFKRGSPLIGPIPQNWIDENLPKCPLCKKPSRWEIGIEMTFGPFNRYQFRCPNCMAVYSTPIPKVQFLGVTSGIAGFADKTMKIKSIGNNKNLQHLEGEEYSLEVLQDWAIHENATTNLRRKEKEISGLQKHKQKILILSIVVIIIVVFYLLTHLPYRAPAM